MLGCDDGPDSECSGDSVGTCDVMTGTGRNKATTSWTESIYGTDTESIEDYRIIVSNGVPNHCYQNNQIQANPNVACEIATAILAPLVPRTTAPTDDEFEDTPQGIVGIATSGAFIYNHLSAEECNPAAIQERANFDPCDGHADGACRYHYHKAPVCIEGYDNCGLLGYMVDGVPVYGMCSFEIDGAETRFRSCYSKNITADGCDAENDWTYIATDDCHLDKANGYFFEEELTSTSGVVFEANTYAYFMTLEFPFVMPKLANSYNRACHLSMA